MTPLSPRARLSPLRLALGLTSATTAASPRSLLLTHYTLLRGPVEPKQFTSWAFSQRVRDAQIAPSMGAVGCAYDNAMMESFWGRMQVELLDRRRWKTRIELASAIHDYIELWHNTRRRHSSLGMLTPSEIETVWATAHDNGVVHTGLAQTAPTVLIDEGSAAGLAGTSERNVPIDHQHLLLNSNHTG